MQGQIPRVGAITAHQLNKASSFKTKAFFMGTQTDCWLPREQNQARLLCADPTPKGCLPGALPLTRQARPTPRLAQLPLRIHLLGTPRLSLAGIPLHVSDGLSAWWLTCERILIASLPEDRHHNSLTQHRAQCLTRGMRSELSHQVIPNVIFSPFHAKNRIKLLHKMFKVYDCSTILVICNQPNKGEMKRNVKCTCVYLYTHTEIYIYKNLSVHPYACKESSEDFKCSRKVKEKTVSILRSS